MQGTCQIPLWCFRAQTGISCNANSQTCVCIPPVNTVPDLWFARCFRAHSHANGSGLFDTATASDKEWQPFERAPVENSNMDSNESQWRPDAWAADNAHPPVHAQSVPVSWGNAGARPPTRAASASAEVRQTHHVSTFQFSGSLGLACIWRVHERVVYVAAFHAACLPTQFASDCNESYPLLCAGACLLKGTRPRALVSVTQSMSHAVIFRANLCPVIMHGRCHLPSCDVRSVTQGREQARLLNGTGARRGNAQGLPPSGQQQARPQTADLLSTWPQRSSLREGTPPHALPSTQILGSDYS